MSQGLGARAHRSRGWESWHARHGENLEVASGESPREGEGHASLSGPCSGSDMLVSARLQASGAEPQAALACVGTSVGPRWEVPDFLGDGVGGQSGGVWGRLLALQA